MGYIIWKYVDLVMRSLYFLRGCKNVLHLREIILKENKTLFFLFHMYLFLWMNHGTLLFHLVCNHHVFFVPGSTYSRISKCENPAGSLGCCCAQQSSCWSTYFSIETVHCHFSNNGWFHFKVKGMLKFSCYLLIILDVHVINLWQSEIQGDPHTYDLHIHRD